MANIEILESRIIAGYLPGLRQPAAKCILRADSLWLQQLRLTALTEALTVHLPDLSVRAATPGSPAALGQFLLDVITALMQHVYIPVLEPCQLHCREEAATCVLQLVVPMPDTRQLAPNQTLSWLVEFLDRDVLRLEEADVQRLESLVRSFRLRAPQGPLTKRLLTAAFDQGIPWVHLTGNVYQFGWGNKGRLLDGTFTDRTPAIAARVARNKAATVDVLRGAGLPAPTQRLVQSADDAVRHAERLGWPVVIKPIDLDGGVGVAAGLGSAAEVRRAFDAARQHSRHIALENHIAGKDYRVVLIHGRVVGVWERTPGGVTGDGRRNLRDLLAAENADWRRQPKAERRKQIVVDAEALELLEIQQLDLDSVPAAGHFVRLRRTSNIATGGSAEPVAPDAVHPDNKVMCERAAGLLRLDVAGVDLLMPDIGRSWFEGGAAICEVNAQPQLSAEFPAVVMQTLIAGNGRIPVVVVMDEVGAAGWLDPVLAALQQAGVHAGVALGGELRSGNQTILHETRSAAHGAQILLRDSAVRMLVLRLHDAAQLRSGFPVDRCDLLVLAEGSGFAGKHETIARTLDAGMPRVLVNADSALWQQWPAPDARTQRVPFAQLGARVMQYAMELARS